MRISVKCSSAVHVLLMIAVLPAQQKVTSELLAGSVGCNPVEIRRLLGKLKKAGIIDVARGTGGATLRKKAKEITLLDIYSAVDEASLDELIGVHTHPLAQCPFGKNITQILSEPYAEIGSAVKRQMAAVTLDQMLARLREMEPSIENGPCA